MKPIPQEEAMGCGIACVASICELSYKKAKRNLFYGIGNDRSGYYCRDLIKALDRSGRKYGFSNIKNYEKKKGSKFENGTIVYVKEIDHYLLKTGKGWMDSWLNYPTIGKKIRAGFRITCLCKPQWVVFPFK